MIVTDIYPAAVDRLKEQYGVSSVSPNEIYDVEADIFSPNALGGILQDDTIARLQCQIIAGAANNQLQTEQHGELLQQKGIYYAPDYVINAGGLIHVADELYGYNQERVRKKVEQIYDNIIEVFQIAKREQIPSSLAADRLAEQRIQAIGSVHRTYVQQARSALDFYQR